MMSRCILPCVSRRIVSALVFLSLHANAPAQAPAAVPAPAAEDEQQVVSIGDALRQQGTEPLHILYVHGIGAIGAQDSLPLRRSICRHAKEYLKAECTTEAGEPDGREYADEGVFAIGAPLPDVQYMGAPMWTTAEEWQAGAPFVDHYVIRMTNHQSILVDEINWWPLVFAVKCQHMIPNETLLAGSLHGRDDNFVALCGQETMPDKVDGRFDSYNWLKAAGLDIATLNNRRGHAVLINRWGKVQIMDWNFSDAVLGVGPLERYLVEAIRELLVKCVDHASTATTALTGNATAPFDPRAEYITVTHSLGSFLMFSALHVEYESDGMDLSADQVQKRKDTLQYMLGRLSQAYFFANQIPLLELAKLSNSQKTTFIDLSGWREARARVVRDQQAPLGQIVAWGDANDLLSWYLGKDFRSWQNPRDKGNPDCQRFYIRNYLVKNATRWLWLIENPESAHDNYATNPVVIRALLKRRR
jgi:hypothetical protein